MIVIKGQIHSSKNSRQIFKNRKTGSSIVAKSDNAKSDEYMIGMQLNIQREEWERMTTGLEYPLFVVFHFVRKTDSVWDFVNLVQGVADAMVKAEYIPDDDVKHFIPVWGDYSVDKNDPGVEFWIEGRKHAQ